MFTGIIEEIGTVAQLTSVTGGSFEDGVRLTITANDTLEGLSEGASIAVDGACLTAVAIRPDSFVVEAVPETMVRTTLGRAEVGTQVNLERAMPANGRFDGHIVQGHVDGVGRIAGIDVEGEGRRLRIEAPDTVGQYLVEKGSVTVDGISLTLAAVKGSSFEIALIPHTLAVTSIGRRQVGDMVNLEADILAKYVQRLMAR